MLTDPREQHIAAAFRAARLLPRAGWEDRALAALAGVHPRRHPNLLTYIIVAALILLLAAGLFAAARYFFVEGTLQFLSFRVEDEYTADGTCRVITQVFSGAEQWATDSHPPPLTSSGDVCPVSGQLVRGVQSHPMAAQWQRPALAPPAMRIVRSNPDGSDEVDLTEIAGLDGINCGPTWSPDGTMIAFQHSDPVEGLRACVVGMYAWVMNADGTAARALVPELDIHARSGLKWSPDGSRILAFIGHAQGIEERSAVSIDPWRNDFVRLPNVGPEPKWSPDGSMIVSIDQKPAVVDGQEGWWNQLLLTDADGGNPRVLVEQFISRADIESRYPDDRMLEVEPEIDWINTVRHYLGPRAPVWSPKGNKIAFQAAMPFHPDGPLCKNQIEVWVYDLRSDELIRLTDDDLMQSHLRWE